MYYTKTPESIIKELETSASLGLTHHAVVARRTLDGHNELPEPVKESLVLKFLSEFTDPLILLLIAAAGISFFLGEGIDALAIIAIVVINAVIGFSQEYKAEKAIEALKKMSSSFTKVMRDGKIHKVETRDLVAGDIIILGAGDKIPADARIIESANLEVSEAILTGESIPVKKSIDVIHKHDLSLGDQKNMLFKDTAVTFGRGVAIVTATGVRTEVGKISTLLREEGNDVTPLQKEIIKIGKNLSLAALGIIGIIFVFELVLEQADIKLAFLSAVSLAVAAIPEGLPAVITIVLAVGVTRLTKERVIIRKLPAVETLGATTHILTDKTGTLTQNRMMVTDIFTIGGDELQVTGEGYIPTGSFIDKSGHVTASEKITDLSLLLSLGALCNDAVLDKNPDTGKWEIIGDVTEGALIVVAEKASISAKFLASDHPRVGEVPFSSDTKIMTTVHVGDLTGAKPMPDMVTVIVKGAPEMLLPFCVLTEDVKKRLLSRVDRYAGDGLRSLGFAYRVMSKSSYEDLKKREVTVFDGLVFAGLMAQKDPLRLEVKHVLPEAKQAGVTTVMVTGDHKLTAYSIARELGIASNPDEAMTGEELTALSPEEFDRVVLQKRVFARVSPEQKLKLVKAYKKAGHIVAVTGDGVNDAPAIKAADIGISMGIEGTDVSKEASDMILQDDNYTAIVAAIREGRIVFDNLIKVITYLISCNMSEIMIIFLAVIMGYPLPLLPIHLLWINLVTDGFPSLALGMEPGEKDIMRRKPRHLADGILTRKRWMYIVAEGIIIGLATFVAFRISHAHFGLEVARTVTFLTLNLAQLIHSFSMRSERRSLFEMGIGGNKLLLGVFMLSILIQIPVIYSPFGEHIFSAVALDGGQVGLALSMALVPFVAVELMKYFKRRGKVLV